MAAASKTLSSVTLELGDLVVAEEARGGPGRDDHIVVGKVVVAIEVYHLLVQIDLPFPATCDMFFALRPQQFAGLYKRKM